MWSYPHPIVFNSIQDSDERFDEKSLTVNDIAPKANVDHVCHIYNYINFLMNATQHRTFKKVQFTK